MSLVRNERIKLLAAALDRISTACVTVGILAPTAASAVGSVQTGTNWVPIVFLGISSLFAAGVLHLSARRALGGLQS